MVKEIRIYYEGDVALKQGFRAFFREIWDAAAPRRCYVQLIAAKGSPARDFHKGRRANPESWNVLLLDSESAVGRPLTELCAQRGLAGLSDSVFWMVQCMEAWFLADVGSLRRYYRKGFLESALPGNPRIEEIPKTDVLSGLKAATRNSGRGKYHKTAHPPALLAILDPELVKAAAPNCKRLFDVAHARLAGE